jgi:hypothetical protein
MSNANHPPDSLIITTLFECPGGDGVSNQNYRDVILRTLKKILPADFFQYKETDQAKRQHQKHILQQVIPLITCSNTRNFPATLSFFALSKYRSSSFKFFFEMISRWLTPGRRLNVVLVYASDFRLTYLSEEVYTICEVMISVADSREFEEIQRNFPIIETEIALGIHSEFYAQRILEIKGLSADDKTALIQGFIASLVKRFPHHYDTDVFTEMQHILVTCRDEFKAVRQARHLSRIISIQYLFRKALKEAIKKSSHRRHLSLKIFRAVIQASGGRKRILGVLVGINFLRDQENFGEKHLLKAIQHYIPSVLAVEHSFFIHKLGSENICISYIEVEKRDGSHFTGTEIRKLRRELPANLKNRIEHRLHNVFMPRNEEEVMRNILTLTNQIKYVRDIPQVLISFDEQAYAHLYFTVILARLLKPESCSIADLFKRGDTVVEYLHDRTKIMGHVRKKYAKEATVFRLKLPKETFLRADHSIDLYKARQTVVGELTKMIGEIRDYNGGMISKQHELLSAIRNLLSDVKDYDELLLDNFFYSLAPVVVRALLDPNAFKTLFLMLIEGIKDYKQEGYYLKFQAEPYNVFALIIMEDFSVKDSIHRAIQDLYIPSTELACAHVKTHGNTCLGYICCAHDSQKKERFFQAITQTLKSWELSHGSSKKVEVH